jgi:methyl-accepting chemotaxis protein
MSPKHQTIIGTTSINDDSGSVLLGDVTSRLGRLEDQVNKILPVLGQVSQAVENLSSSLQDIKADVKSVGVSFSDFQLSTVSHEDRIKGLEESKEALEKAQATHRYDLIKIIGTGIVSLIVGVLVAFIKLK